MKLVIKTLSLTLIMLIPLLVFRAAYAVEQEKTTDVRVIIDVSGSMKKNDPKNLRVPALKLLIGLLPEGVKAGVWTFGTHVKPLVKHGVVDKKWKDAAYKSVNKITSNNLYTNIEKALTVVSKGWEKLDPSDKRNIILLTDGMIDISKDVKKNTASRERALKKILPQLRKQGVNVNTVSLSENADLELNDALAMGTDGWSELVNDAKQLQRVFLRMFEKSAPRDTVPLKDNEFTIDKLIDEFTILVFRNDPEKSTTITAPNGQSFTVETRPKGVAWLHEDGYDMVTISKPEAGVWKINGDMDPDNRVMVVTKLKLHTEGLPSRIFLGEKYTLNTWITAADKTIDKDEFYQLIDIKLLQHDGDNIQEVWELDQRNNENRFSKEIGDGLVEGRVQFSVIVDGKTFKREQLKTVNVYESIIDVEVKDVKKAGSEPRKQIHIKPKKDLIDVKTLSIDAEILTPNGQELKKPAKPALLGSEWLVAINDVKKGQYTVVLDVQAKSVSGRDISVKTAPFMFGDEEVIEEEENEDPAPEAAEENEKESEGKEIDWVMLGIYLLIANVVIVTLVGLVWFIMKKRKKKTDELEAQL